MPLLYSDVEGSTAGCCADCGHMVQRRDRCLDEHTNTPLDLCVRCMVLFYHRRQFESGCCG